MAEEFIFYGCFEWTRKYWNGRHIELSCGLTKEEDVEVAES